MAPAGWSVAGLLEPIWSAKFGTRDNLARVTGIPGPALSGYNTGRLRLGIENARKIADAAGVSLAELGAPEEATRDDPRSVPLLDRLATVEGRVADLERIRDELVASMLGRLDSLEADVRFLARRSPSRSVDGR